jgi:hypothetical protein
MNYSVTAALVPKPGRSVLMAEFAYLLPTSVST